VEITLETNLSGVLKAAEKFKLINSIVQEFKGNKVASCEAKDVYYVERKLLVPPDDSSIGIRMILSVRGTTVQVIQSLETLVGEGKEANHRLVVEVGQHSVVNQEGDLLSDDDIIKLVWSRSMKKQVGRRVGLAYGSIVYSSWSKDLIPVVITIMNGDVIRRIVDGESRYLLPETRVKWFYCSVCGGNFEDCEHRVGEEYDDGKICTTIPREIQFLEGSVVGRAIDTRCKISDLLLLDEGGSVFEWYGFDKINPQDRIKRINDARKDGLIPREVLEKFRAYFSKRSVGRCRYRVSGARERATSHRKATRA
jgi:hypothetical protein